MINIIVFIAADFEKRTNCAPDKPHHTQL